MKKKISASKTKIINYFNSVFLKGERVVCEMCNWKGKVFPKNKCPKCNSYARTRLIPFSIRYFKIGKGDINLLHVAPNLSEYHFIQENFNYRIYDRLNIMKAKHINLLQDLTHTNIKNNQYDLIIIWHVLEHIPKDTDAIKEMYRILKPNGKLLVSVPIYPTQPVRNAKTFEDENIDCSKYEEVHGHHDHCRSCGLDYYERFEKVGFKTNTLHVEDLEVEDVISFGLSKNHTVWLFEKP